MTRSAIAEGKTVGLVPTMGYLHEGHASLIRAARAKCDFVVVSDFVNPTQFGPTEDYATYPRDEAADLALCAACGADVLFIPDVAMLYPNGQDSTWVEVSRLGTILCGASRPGHFRGVATVVTKLLMISRADYAFFGEKITNSSPFCAAWSPIWGLRAKSSACPSFAKPTDSPFRREMYGSRPRLASKP